MAKPPPKNRTKAGRPSNPAPATAGKPVVKAKRPRAAPPPDPGMRAEPEMRAEPDAQAEPAIAPFPEPMETRMTDETPNPAAAFTPKMREAAEQSVAQAKKAYEQYTASAERMFHTMAESARQVWAGTRDYNQRVASFADVNAKASFDYAERLVRARDAKEAAEIQQGYMRESAERFGQQMRELNEIASKAVKETFEAAKPKT